MIDYYGEDANYIHLKFGHIRKMYNFTPEFMNKYPNFVAEYKKYWNGDSTCRFNSTLEVVQYIDTFEVPVHLYFNYTDTPVKDMSEVYEYFIREYSGITIEPDGSWRKEYDTGLDGESPNAKNYKVFKEE